MNAYVSRELTHFVGRGLPPDKQYNLLVKILRNGWLTHPPHKNGPSGGNLSISRNGRICSGQLYRTEAVCFCDIPEPLRRIHMNKYSEFGISFLKRFLVLKGASPVFYVAGTSLIKDGGDKVTREKYFNDRVASLQALSGAFDQAFINADSLARSLANQFYGVQQLLDFHVLGFVKCFDPGRDEDHDENYYMEREWRVLGNVDFELSDVSRVTLPSSYGTRFRADFPAYTGDLTFAEDAIV